VLQPLLGDPASFVNCASAMAGNITTSVFWSTHSQKLPKLTTIHMTTHIAGLTSAPAQEGGEERPSRPETARRPIRKPHPTGRPRGDYPLTTTRLWRSLPSRYL